MPDALTLAVVGDVMLGRLVNEVIAQKGPTYVWGDALPLLHEADLLLVNLECALTTETRRWHDGEYKAFYFRADPSAGVETLEKGGVHFASLANNHICDFGTEGLLETLEVLDGAGIAHAGAGADLASARRPARLTAGGLRIAVVASADYPLAWAAGADSPGLNYTPVSVDPQDFEKIEGALAAARQDADLVVFSIHWGPNMRERPTEAFRRFARRVVDAGADVFWGHSAHVVQGIEVYDGKPILYDTGDFVDDYAVDPALCNDLSAPFLVKVEPPAVTALELVPVQLGEMQVNLARGPQRDWYVQKLSRLCEEMETKLVMGPERPSIPLTAR